MLLVQAICIFLCMAQMMQEPTCKPTLSEGRTGKPEIGGYIFFECEISSCLNLSKIVFEKTDLNATWTPIFEGVNNTYSKAFDAVPGYTLKNRHDYYAFRNIVTLNIDRLILQDHGQWRCVGHDAMLGQHESEPLDFIIYVPPADGNFFIRPNHSHLVIGQQREFTCFSHGIHPEPDMRWKVNGVETMGKTAKTQSAEQLWTVMNTINIRFKTVGVQNLTCAVKAKARDVWFEDHINITVKEQAVVLYPLYDMTITVDVDTTFALRCGVTGYNPHITWKHNGEDRHINDTRYIIKDRCDNTSCESSITSKPMDSTLACGDKEEYSGLYTCVATVKPPYLSSATSSNMNVTILKRHCKGKSNGQTVGLSMLSIVGVVLIATVIGSLLYLNRRRKRQANKDEEDTSHRLLEHNKTSVDIAFFKGMALQATIMTEYKTEVYLKKCFQTQCDDKLVLFDFQKDRVFMHDMFDLTQYTEYTCDVNIFDMLHTSNSRFVVTGYQTRHIHLFHLKEGRFHKLDILTRDSGHWRPLICADTDTSFIWCDISGYEPFDINIFRGDITNDQLVSKHITKVTLKTTPTYVSLTPDRTKLVMVNDRATIYTVNLDSADEDHNMQEDHNVENKDVDGWVRSLYIDRRANIIIGDRSQIIVYTNDKKRYVVPRVCERVRGVTVKNKRIIVNCGRNGKQQYIRVYKNDNITQFPHVEESISEDINFYQTMEEQDTIKPEYNTVVYLKKCFDRQNDNKLVLFDCKTDRIFIHDMSDLTQYKEYKCDMNILDMIRISHNRFVVTEYINRHIHLLHFIDGKCLKLDTLSQKFDDWHALICAFKDDSFIWCDLEGHEPFVIEISRVDIINDKLTPNRVRNVTFNTRPSYISVKSDNTVLVLVNDRATIYKVDLESYDVEEDHNMENIDVDGWVRSLYIDQHDNIIIGNGSQINVYTHDKKRCIVPIKVKLVRGVTVSNGRIIVNCGFNGQKQYIKVYKPHDFQAPLSVNDNSLTED